MTETFFSEAVRQKRTGNRVTFDRVNFVLRQTPEKVLYNVKRFSDLCAAITGGPLLRRDIAGKLPYTEQMIGNI